MTGSLPPVFAHRSTDLLRAVKLMKTGFDLHGEKTNDLPQSTLPYFSCCSKAPGLLRAIPAASGVSLQFSADRARADPYQLGNLSLPAPLLKQPVNGISVSLAEASVSGWHCLV